MDFAFEQNLYRTNKQIEKGVETIYLMPDDDHSLISSSWVKSLMGCNSWTKVIENSVTPFVLEELKKWYLKSKLHEILESFAFKQYILEGQEDYIWDEICKQYERRHYHNLDHIISFLEGLKLYENDHKLAHKYPIMVYSAFMHDIDPDENKSAEIACSYLRMMSQSLTTESVKDTITRLIMATKHIDTRISTNEDEQIMASIDLMVLAGNEKDYAKYTRDVYSEYLQRSGMNEEEFAKVWIEKRGKFLENMLSKPYIIPLESLRNRIESNVKTNLKFELNMLKSALNKDK